MDKQDGLVGHFDLQVAGYWVGSAPREADDGGTLCFPAVLHRQGLTEQHTITPKAFQKTFGEIAGSALTVLDRQLTQYRRGPHPSARRRGQRPAPAERRVSTAKPTRDVLFARSGTRRRPNSAEPSAQAPGTERCRGGSGKQLPPPCARLSNRRCAEEDQGGHERRHRWVIEMLAVKRVAAVR